MAEDKSIPISPDALAAFAVGAPGAANHEETIRSEQQAKTSDTPHTPAAEATAAPSEPENEHTSAPKDPRYPIRVLSGFCTRLAGSTCDRCIYICPYDAISFDAESRPQIDTDHCARCGLCCGMCDAFVTERITQNDLLDKVNRLSDEGDPVIFTCYDQIPEDFEVHANVIVLPCIGAVAPEFWASALEITPNISIYCNFNLCDNCPTAGPDARNLFTHAVNTGELWAQHHMGKTDKLPEKTDILTKFFDATEDEFQRRGIATSLVNEVEDIASGRHRKRNSDTLTNYHENREHLRAQGHAQNARHHEHIPSSVSLAVPKVFPRLRMISTAVQEHPEMAPRIPRYLAAVENDICEHCYDPCFIHCPSGARTLDNHDNIQVDLQLCIACGNCAFYCPTGAAYLFETDGSIFLEESGESGIQNCGSNQ